MTPQFITACYIKIDDVQQRKEVCEKLEQMGYSYLECTHKCRPTLRKVLFTNGNKLFRVPISDAKFICKGIECDSIPLFLDLAGMRSDTDKGQWFLRIDTKEMGKCNTKDFSKSKLRQGFWRKATAQEIIEWHKQKGETK